MAARRMPIIAGNWKMNKTVEEAVDLSQKISYGFDRRDDEVEIVLCPPFTDIKSVWVVLATDHSRIKVGAQDVYPADSGAYTGCISPVMLEALHCAYCIVGHSERRQYFGETDADVNAKVKALQAKGIVPIMCCGESLEVRDGGTAVEYVCAQVAAGIEGVSEADVAKMVIAYEPIWAIGTGRSATPEQAQEMCAAIRATVARLVSQKAADALRILYGGSMKPANAELFLPQPDIDGGLIGGAALVASDFIDLVRTAQKYA